MNMTFHKIEGNFSQICRKLFQVKKLEIFLGRISPPLESDFLLVCALNIYVCNLKCTQGGKNLCQYVLGKTAKKSTFAESILIKTIITMIIFSFKK